MKSQRTTGGDSVADRGELSSVEDLQARTTFWVVGWPRKDQEHSGPYTSEAHLSQEGVFAPPRSFWGNWILEITDAHSCVHFNRWALSGMPGPVLGLGIQQKIKTGCWLLSRAYSGEGACHPQAAAKK